MFKQLKGIEKGREETNRTSNLDCLLDACDNLLREHKRFSTNLEKTNNLNILLAKAYNRVKTTSFSEHDLNSLILAKANKDLERPEAQAAGRYTGILLQALTERKEKEGKKARFYINGQGNKFDYLFYNAKNIGNLIVENFRGEYICAHLGGEDVDGSINTVAGIGLEGHNALSVCSAIKEGIMIGKNIQGRSVMEFAGAGSKIGMVLAQDIEGDCVLFGAAAKGKADFIFAENIKGDEAMERAGVEEGKIGVIYARNISGQNTLYCAGTGESQEGVEYDSGKIDLVLYDLPGKRLNGQVNAKRIISHRNKKLPKLVSDYKIQQFFKLITPIDKVPVEGKFAILDEIKALYKSIRQKVEK